MNGTANVAKGSAVRGTIDFLRDALGDAETDGDGLALTDSEAETLGLGNLGRSPKGRTPPTMMTGGPGLGLALSDADGERAGFAFCSRVSSRGRVCRSELPRLRLPSFPLLRIK